MAKEEKKDLKSILSNINKTLGNGTISYGSDELGNLGVISTGILSVNKITGIGGIPRGRITDIGGMDGCFKTSLALSTISEEQKNGNICAFIDAEYSFSPEYAEEIGVDTSKLIIIHPASAEEAYSIIEQLVESEEVSLIVLDSMTALSPNAELNNEFGSSNMGVMARLNGQFFRKLTAKIGKTRTTLLILQQMREALGGYVPMKVTPGGNAIRFYASMRFEVSKSAIKEGIDIKGVTLKVKCVKNKLSIPFLFTEIEAIYGKGIDKTKDLINTACDYEIIKKAGAGWMTYGEHKIQGLDNFKELLLNNEQIRTDMENKVMESMSA